MWCMSRPSRARKPVILLDRPTPERQGWHPKSSYLTILVVIKSWVDAHANLPRPGKVDRESGCGSKRATKREASTLRFWRLFCWRYQESLQASPPRTARPTIRSGTVSARLPLVPI